jgi:hypothetical protein
VGTEQRAELTAILNDARSGGTDARERLDWRFARAWLRGQLGGES